MNRRDISAAESPIGIVYFGNDWFAENRTSSHHIAQRLAQRFPVIYVDSPGMRAPSATGRDFRRLARKLADALRGPRELTPGFWYCTVPQMPFRRLPGAEMLNRWFGLWAVRRAIRTARLDRFLSWFVVPHPGFMAQHLGEDLCIYYCIDDYAAHPGVDSERISQSDRDLTHAADQVFVAPPALLEAKSAQNPTTVFSPHGVDAELFARAMDPVTQLPPFTRELPRPVIGFFGLIADWIDTELICWLADQRPSWSFLLVGAQKTDIADLRRRSNIHLPGPQPYGELPGWARAFDVAIIPYRLNQQVKNANPLKLREYLATGRPVVTVRNPEIERFARWVQIADSREEFLEAIEAALEPEPASAIAERMASVSEMTWDHRVKEVLDTVDRALARRHGHGWLEHRMEDHGTEQ